MCAGIGIERMIEKLEWNGEVGFVRSTFPVFSFVLELIVGLSRNFIGRGAATGLDR